MPVSFISYCLDWIDKHLEKRNPKLAGIIREFLLQREEEYEDYEALELYNRWRKENGKRIKCSICGEDCTDDPYTLPLDVSGNWQTVCRGCYEKIKEDQYD